MPVPVMEQVPAKVLQQREVAYARLRGEVSATDPLPTLAQDPETPGTPVIEPAPRPDIPQETPEPAPLVELPPAAVAPQPAIGTGEMEGLRAELRRQADALSTLQGKYNAEVPRLHEALRERDDEIARMRQQAMQIPDPTKPMTDDELKSVYGLTDEDLADRTLVDTIRRISATDARKAAALAREAVREEVEPVKRDFQRTAQQTFHERLTQTVPDFDTLNNDPAFVGWLHTNKVPYTNTPLIDRINDAYDVGDLKTVVAIVDAYRAATGQKKVERPSVAAQRTPEPRANTRPADPRVTYTLDEYQALAAKLTKLPPGSVEYLQLHKELNAARAEGRIVPRR